MIEEFMHIMREKCLLPPSEKVLVGLSGGADSQVLLHLLVGSGYQVIAAHFNHQLRPEAESEAHQARVAANNLGCPFVESAGNVSQYAQANSLSLEEAARILRYSFLFQEAELAGAAAVAVAHQADDQVETMLMHLLRGSGITGLKGMEFRSSDPLGISSLPLIRPLLGFWHEEIEAYCQQYHLHPTIDQSNFDPTYFRNRIRLELIPELESFNPQVKKHLWQTGILLGDENAWLESQTREFMQTTLVEQGKGWILFDVDQLKRIPPVFQKRVLRSLVFSLRNTIRDVDYDMVERTLDFLLTTNAYTTIQLSHGVDLLRLDRSKALFLLRSSRLLDLWPQLLSKRAIPLPKSGVIPLNEFWQFEISTGRGNEVEGVSADRWRAMLDQDRLSAPLMVTTRETGDTFAPFGLQGKRIKLGDFWTNEHLPARARDYWPIIRCGDEIAWVPGFRIAEPYRVTTATRRMICIHLKKLI